MDRKKLDQWLERIRPFLKKDNMILMILAGILILIIALPSGKKKEGTEELDMRMDQVPQGDVQEGTSKKEDLTDEEEYRKSLQRELTSILKQIDGAGEVCVMITLKESRELVVEKDAKKEQKQTEERELSGTWQTGSDVITETVTTVDKAKDPFVVKAVYPKVEGVIVAAQGVGKGRVKNDISEAVQALFGLEAHKVKVVKLGHILSQEGIK